MQTLLLRQQRTLLPLLHAPLPHLPELLPLPPVLASPRTIIPATPLQQAYPQAPLLRVLLGLPRQPARHSLA